MDDLSPINGAQYVLPALSTTSAAVTIEDKYRGRGRVFVDNSVGTVAAFVVCGATSPTAVFPTSATVAVEGFVIGPGDQRSFALPRNAIYVAGIRASATAADLYINITTGE